MVVIIGILAAIAIPFFLGQRAKAADARAQANVREAASAVNVYYTEEGEAPADVTPDSLGNYGWRGSTPPVTGWAAGGAAEPNWCVATITDGGTVDSFKMEDEDSAPVAGVCPGAPAAAAG